MAWDIARNMLAHLFYWKLPENKIVLQAEITVSSAFIKSFASRTAPIYANQAFEIATLLASHDEFKNIPT